ncbi:MAG TPA: OsmC family protein [Salinivirga sp.]|uniref:OsmC family protein n=1 Tax=Salinivirga sp. TaxID=1970192 RepID=UPI002B4A5D7D|nr:OsmC family protein [Salinivirga sp.]HKK59851.1 OsmC family protein [Salinivirga sp.]
MAISKVKVNGKVNDGFRTEIGCSHNFIIDQPKAMGGNDEGANPMEIFLASLPACICAIGRIIANQKRLDVRSIDVDVEGSIDKDFLLGKTEDGRAGFTEIVTNVKVDADMTQEEKEAFVEEIERRCPIADNIVTQSTLKTIVN